jgi:hypothetical protein
MKKKTVKTINMKKKAVKTAKKQKAVKTEKPVKKTTPMVSPKKQLLPLDKPNAIPPTAPPPPAVLPAATKMETEATKIWNEIRNLPIQMFGLPSQIVAMHCTPISVEPTKLYVKIASSATLPSLESAIGNKFVVELADTFVIIKRTPQPLYLVQK